MLRAIRIDPLDRSVRELHVNGDLHDIYNCLTLPGFRQVDDINAVMIGETHVMWLDGEGLLIPDVPVWKWHGYNQWLAGAALILGTDAAGDNRACNLTLGAVGALVSWSEFVTTGRLNPGSHGTIGRDGYVYTVGGPVLKSAGDL